MKNNSLGQSKLNITHLVPLSSMTGRDCKYAVRAQCGNAPAWTLQLVWSSPKGKKARKRPSDSGETPQKYNVRLSIAAKSRWSAILLRAGGSSGLTPATGLKSIGVGADSVRAEIPGGFGSLSKNASGCPRYAEGHRLRPKSPHLFLHHYYTLLLVWGEGCGKLGVETGAALPLSKGERNRKKQ